MLAAIVRASLRNPRIVTALAFLIAMLGVAALFNARFDVFPDFAPPHVLVQTEAPGLDATQVEALVTRPLEGLLADAAGLLPAGVGPPLLSPLSSSMEYLVHFGFTSTKLSPIELRDLVQWVI